MRHATVPGLAPTPTTDVRVRKAITQGVDIAAVVKSLTKDSQQRAWSLISPDSAYFDTKYDNRGTADVAAAKSLLEQAGWTGKDADGYRTDRSGKRLSIRLLATTPTYPLDDFLKAWQAELRRVRRRLRREAPFVTRVRTIFDPRPLLSRQEDIGLHDHTTAPSRKALR